MVSALQVKYISQWWHDTNKCTSSPNLKYNCMMMGINDWLQHKERTQNNKTLWNNYHQTVTKYNWCQRYRWNTGSNSYLWSIVNSNTFFFYTLITQNWYSMIFLSFRERKNDNFSLLKKEYHCYWTFGVSVTGEITVNKRDVINGGDF